MAIVQSIPAVFRRDLFLGVHNFSADTFKIALYTSSATLNTTTSAYTSVGEITGTGYTAGGITLSGVTVLLGGTTTNPISYISWANPSWPSATFTARGAVVYNTSKSNLIAFILDFGSDKSCANTTFTVQFPTNDATNAILRMA